MKDSNISTKTVYDRKLQEPEFEVGSKVLLHDPTTKRGKCAKLKGGTRALISQWAGAMTNCCTNYVTVRSAKN